VCLSSTLALHFSDYSFWVHHLVNWDDRHLLAHAMASDFSDAWPQVSGHSFLLFMDKIFETEFFFVFVFIQLFFDIN
jgi:hypothetical protein